MTPTLQGRWQTRTLLFAVVGVPLSAPFCLFSFPLFFLPLVVLAVVWGVGMALDPLYDRLQRRRWDHDWPIHLQLLAGLVEGVLGFVFCFGCFGGLALLAPPLLLFYPFHYGLVWTGVFLSVHGPMRVLLPRWRFRGGEVLPRNRAR